MSLKLAAGPQPDLSAAPRALQGSLVLGSQLLASWAAPRMPARGASLVTSSNMRWSEAPAQVLTLALQAPRALHVILLSPVRILKQHTIVWPIFETCMCGIT